MIFVRNRSQDHRGAERAPPAADRGTRARAARASLPRRGAPESRLRSKPRHARPAVDRTWREFRTMLGDIPKAWRRGRRDDAARNELVRTLREVSELDAGRAVIDLLKHGVSADSIWEALFATAAELVLRRPTVVPVHAQTSANAFHHVFRHARTEATQLLALLQSAAFMPGFRRRVRNARPDLRIDELEPLAVSGRRLGSVARGILRAAARSHLRRSQGIALPATRRLRGHVRRQCAPAPGSQRPAVPRLQVHGGRPREPPGNGVHRVAGPDSVRSDGVFHRIRNSAEPRIPNRARTARSGIAGVLGPSPATTGSRK